jgi:hypothetical protein
VGSNPTGSIIALLFALFARPEKMGTVQKHLSSLE